MPKVPYWLGTAVRGTHLLEHLWSLAACPGRLHAGCHPFRRVRWMFGRSLELRASAISLWAGVVSTAAHERSWQGFQQGLEQDAVDMLLLLLPIVRGCPGSTIALQDLFRSDLVLKRAIQKVCPPWNHKDHGQVGG